MQIISDRRALHRIPELDRALPETLAYLENSLKQCRCQVFSPMDGALCAWFDFGAPDAVAFRSDADALPVEEHTGAVYASCHPGKMHACGHDGHMAILLELARQLSGKEKMPHNVLLVFQPGEETTGGARDLCETGIFGEHQVKAIFGLHLWPGLEKGVIASRRGGLMARSSEVHVDVYGRSVHISKAEEGLDAMAAGVEFYRRARKLEQNLPKDVRRLLQFGKLESGTVCNVISDHTHLEGSLRAYEDGVYAHLRDGLLAVGREIEAETGCRVSIRMTDGYPAVWNPEPLYEQVRAVVPFRELETPSMTAEDFSWYQRYLPGMFFFLGIGDTPPLHNDAFDFDDEILMKGADFFGKLAEGIL